MSRIRKCNFGVRGTHRSQAPKQHGPFDNCFMVMCAFTFEACRLRAADLREVANYSLDPSAQVDVVPAVRIKLG